MDGDLLNLIPDELLNLIWKNIKPSIKYCLNKHYFNKYYIYRFCLIHKNFDCYNKLHITTINSCSKCNDLIKFLYNIKFNCYDYYYYILKNNLSFFIEITLNFYIKNLYANVNINKLYQNKFLYKNIYFNNLIDFFNYYCNSDKSKNIINNIIKNYNLSHLIKKSHKNNANKNIRWTI